VIDDARTDITLGRTPEEFARLVFANLIHYRGQAPQSASPRDVYAALAFSVRNFLMRRYRRTTEAYYAANPKFVYYLSAEYLLGPQLPQSLLYTRTEDIAREAMAGLEHPLEELSALESEPGLGNGGLGRLAACYLDSLATLGMPALGYGIRYEFGIFEQRIQDGWQQERPDTWLRYGAPWEFPQPDDMVPVGFGGRVETDPDGNGGIRKRWFPAETVLGEPCHMLVPGFGNGTANALRLWRARASEEFDFGLFDAGDYRRAVESKVLSENITKVLYPNDSTDQGRELRLRQQYFFTACSLRDIIRRFRIRNTDWSTFPDKVAVQLNDTHPVVAIPELMRILIDEENQGWDLAWDICTRTFAYTCHTLLPEALEKWPFWLFEQLLPRHLEIILEINRRFLADVERTHPGDEDLVRRVSLIEEGNRRQVRMAHLAVVGSYSVNGVAELHSRLLRERTLADFAALWPERFNNKTNGVSPRRFLRLANPALAALITERIGDGWLTDLERLRGLEEHAGDPVFREAWRGVKLANKQRLAGIAARATGVDVDPASLFDVMVKRLHEYKRQLLKVLHIVACYRRLKAGDPPPAATFLFGAKAAPGYTAAKLIIKLINSVAETVNGDPDARGRMRVVFLPNFNVDLAQTIYPAADLSEQISLAGKEASGTGNMKFALNGAVTLGTLDGANIEIRERVGEENFFLFGLTTEEVFARRAAGYDPGAVLAADPDLAAILAMIGDGTFSGGDKDRFRPLVTSLTERDEYLLLADYRAYAAAWDRAAAVFADRERWTRMSILNCARTGFFSSDRAILEYCRDIWKVEPVPVDPV